MLNRATVASGLAACLLCACLFPEAEMVQLPPVKDIQRIDAHFYSYRCGTTMTSTVTDAGKINALLAEINALRQTEWRRLTGGKQSQGDSTIDVALYGAEASEQDVAEQVPEASFIMNVSSGVFHLQEADANHRQLMVSGYIMPQPQPVDAYPNLHRLWTDSTGWKASDTLNTSDAACPHSATDRTDSAETEEKAEETEKTIEAEKP